MPLMLASALLLSIPASALTQGPLNCTPFPVTFNHGNGGPSPVSCPGFSIGGAILNSVSLTYTSDYQFGTAAVNTVQQTFTPTGPAGVTYAPPAGTTTTSGGASSTAPGTASATASGAGVTAANFAGGFTVNVTSMVTAGAVATSSGAVSVTYTYSAAAASIAKSFTPFTIQVGSTSILQFTITNPNTTAMLTGIGFSDTLPSAVTATAATSSACGGTYTATAGSVVLTGGSLAGGASCNFSVTVTGTTPGTKNNTSTAVTSTEGGNGNMASATLTVLVAPELTKSFTDSQIELFFGSTTLSFTITNPLANPAPLTGIAFTDVLPSGLTVSAPLIGACGGGTITAVPGSNSISLSGASLASGASCTFSVQVNGTAVGVQTNTTSTITTAEGLVGSPATASTRVQALEFLWFFTESGGGSPVR